MKTLASAFLALLLTASLSAQIVDTLGGTGSAPSGAALPKANVFRVDSSVLLLQYEMYLNIPGAETLTFFIYRHHSKDGGYEREWTKVVPVNGTGQAWYSSGMIAYPLIAGNHYQIGVAWAGTLTYYYITANSGQPVSFGAWHRGTTPRGLPQTFTISGVDIAQYYQRLTTLPLPTVVNVGTPCTSATSPRLVAAAQARLGANLALDLVEAQASSPAIFLINPGTTLSRPIPVFGCDYWLDPLAGPLFTVVQATSAAGVSLLRLPIPNDPWLAGLVLAWQAAVVGPPVALTNAVQFRFN